MRILAIYRHYWPDATPYAHILRRLLEHWAQRGHEVRVLTAQPGYNDIRLPPRPWREELGGVSVQRVGLPTASKRHRLLWALSMAWFLLRAVLHCVFRRRYDLIIANTHPPVLMGWALRWTRFLTGAPYILHAQDLHPESAALAGQLKSPWLIQGLKRVDAQNCRLAKHVVALCDDMKETLRQRGLSGDNVVVINNPPLLMEAPAKAAPPSLFVNNPSVFHVLFAGNLGEYQGLETVLAAAELLRAREDIRFVFLGEGLAKTRLTRQAGAMLDRTVFFLPHQPVDVAFAAMRHAQLGVVSLKEGVYQVAFPSKTMMYLAAGCPLLALVEPASCLARLAREHELGRVPESRDPAAVARIIEQQRQAWRAGAGPTREHLAAQGERLFGWKRMFAAWDELILDAQASDAKKPRSQVGAPVAAQPAKVNPSDAAPPASRPRKCA